MTHSPHGGTPTNTPEWQRYHPIEPPALSPRALCCLGRPGPCTAVIAGEHFFLVDTGPGTAHAMQAANLPRGRLSGVLFTHYHSDHIGDLGEVMTQTWISNAPVRESPLPVYGGPGIVALAEGFNRAYEKDIGHREVHHSKE